MSQIDTIYLFMDQEDLAFARSCLASIRYFYPGIPLLLVNQKPETPLDLKEMSQYWDVQLYHPEERNEQTLWGGDFAYLQLLTQKKQERALFLTGRSILVGRVLDEAAKFSEDFVASTFKPTAADLAKNIFIIPQLKKLDEGFKYPGYCLQSSAFVARTGVITRSELSKHLVFDDNGQPKLKKHKIFRRRVQGLFNYLVLSAVGSGKASLQRLPMIIPADDDSAAQINRSQIHQHSPYPRIIWWEKAKERTRFRHLPNGDLLQRFEREYYKRVPAGVFKFPLRWMVWGRVDPTSSTSIGKA